MRKIQLLFLGFLTSFIVAAQDNRPAPQPAPDTYEKFKVGMAGFTFANFDLDKTLETMEKCDVHYLCIKDFHLPLNSTDAEIAAFHEKLKSKGVTGYAVGPIYMRSKEEVDKGFEYAKRVGVKLIVGVPNHDLLPYVNQKVKEYDFEYAIHLHGRASGWHIRNRTLSLSGSRKGEGRDSGHLQSALRPPAWHIQNLCPPLLSTACKWDPRHNP